MNPTLPPVAVLIAHRVADYDTWKKAFDDHLPVRKEAGCLGHHINRGADDPNMVYVYSSATDAGSARGFLESPDLEDVMKKAGVEGPPRVHVMRPMSADFIPDKMLAGMIVSHAVEDYATWRKVYDDFDLFRKESGIVGHAVNQEFDDPNRVIVYHQAESLNTLRAFEGSNELKERMRDGGVAEPLEIRFVEVVDFADY
jgi:quinol monooxygenase YgiN